MSLPPAMAPMSPVPGPPLRVRGRVPLLLGIALMVVGLALAVAGGALAVNGTSNKIDTFPRVAVPTTAPFTLARVDFASPGGYVAYYEAAHLDMRQLPLVRIALLAPSGVETVLDTPYGGRPGGTRLKRLTYDVDGHHGAALWQFRITQAGTYRVAVFAHQAAAPGAQIAFGRSIATLTVGGAVLVLVGVLVLAAGVALLVVGLVKRSRSKSQIAAARFGGYPPPGYGAAAGYPPPGYGPPPPPYPAAPYPPAPYPPAPYPPAPYPAAPSRSAYPPPYPATPPAGAPPPTQPPVSLDKQQPPGGGPAQASGADPSGTEPPGTERPPGS